MAPKKKTTTTAAVTDDAPESKSTGVKGRLFMPLQSAGRMGKSTVTDLYVGWLDHADVPWRGVDMDGVHKTFSRAYKNVTLMPLEEKDILARMLDALATTEPVPVSVCDMPAQSTDKVLAAFRQYGAIDLLAGAGIKMVVPLFLVDDQGARESLAKVVGALRDRVDYVLIRNPVKGSSERVEAVPAVASMIADGVPVITLPELSSVSLAAIQTLTNTQREFFSLASVGPLLPGLPRLEIEKFCARVWRQMEEAADVLLPDPKLIVNRVQGGHAEQDADEADPFAA